MQIVHVVPWYCAFRIARSAALTCCRRGSFPERAVPAEAAASAAPKAARNRARRCCSRSLRTRMRATCTEAERSDR